MVCPKMMDQNCSLTFFCFSSLTVGRSLMGAKASTVPALTCIISYYSFLISLRTHSWSAVSSSGLVFIYNLEHKHKHC